MADVPVQTNDPKEQRCAVCKQMRLPRYKTDKSWTKHQEFCKDPDIKREVPDVKRTRTDDMASVSSVLGASEVGHSSVDLKNDASVKVAETSCKVPNLDDLPGLVQSLAQQIEGIDFATVQLGVTLGEGKLSKEMVSRLAHGSGATVRTSAEEDATQQLAKQKVLDRLRQEFRQRFPVAELVSQDPDLKLLLDMSLWQILRPIPTAIFLYGRYRKLVRGIPQTRWPCAVCRGERNSRYGKRKIGSDAGSGKADKAGASEGEIVCKSCKGSGLQYADSVQDLIGCSLVAAFVAEDGVFHGMGREDIDVRCLGCGRPFVLELKAPRKRSPLQELEALAAKVNVACAGKVELSGPLRLSNRAEPARLKAAAASKTYTIRFRVEGGVKKPEHEECILALAGRVLDQRTPARVEHRRADLVRGRTILSLGPLVVENDEIELTIQAESGTYIKEFVHGDEGRTVPSVSGALGRRCDVIWLDVRDIHGE